MHAQTMLAPTAASIKTRFGEIQYDETKSISFPNGLLGMPSLKKFIISSMPDKIMDKFQLLQSTTEAEVSFAVIPLALLGDIIDESDLEEVRQVLEMEKKNFLPILIVSIQRTPEGVKLSANVRAPIFIDVETKMGYQIVLTNSKYPVQHFI